MITGEGLNKRFIPMPDQYEEKVLYLLSHYNVILPHETNRTRGSISILNCTRIVSCMLLYIQQVSISFHFTSHANGYYLHLSSYFDPEKKNKTKQNKKQHKTKQNKKQKNKNKKTKTKTTKKKKQKQLDIRICNKMNLPDNNGEILISY